MIPKIIHYCWFGGNPLDDMALRCIESWKNFFPDYQIIQWNEHNFDISQIRFMEQAYKHKKWAFVSDVARLLVVYKMGGLYFDTDVEVLTNFEDILHEDVKGFLGYETTKTVNTGVGFGAMPQHPFLAELLDVYKNIDFEQYITRLSEVACPILTTQLLVANGYVVENRKQECRGFIIYPSEYFSPIDYVNGKLLKTRYTHSIHWYNDSWNTEESKKEHKKAQKLRRIFGLRLGEVLYGMLACIKNEGLITYICVRLKKIIHKKEN